EMPQKLLLFNALNEKRGEKKQLQNETGKSKSITGDTFEIPC
ncbi:hypothetical protein CEXT_160831, partial [Caerostris extrusa]